MASETTVHLAGRGVVWRELDAIRVKGRSEPVKIYEPIAAADAATPAEIANLKSYAAGLERWRARDFAGAAAAFAQTAAGDPPAARFLKRAEDLMKNPPGESWQPVNALEEK
jgi:hypothetical protein